VFSSRPPMTPAATTRIRALLVIAVGVILLLPAGWMTLISLTSAFPQVLLQVFDGPFLGAVKRSLVLMGYVLGLAFGLGWPLGVLLGTYKFPGKTAGFVCLAVPLFTPTFLWAIGVSSVRPFFSYRNQQWFDGLSGSVLTCVLQVVPLVALVASAAARTLTESQTEAVRIASGAWGLLRWTARYVLPVSLCAALLGALMTLSDPGTGQIMGYHGIASEILIAFASKHDAGLAARKAIALGLVLSPVIGWLSWRMAYWADRQFLGRDLRRAEPIEPGRKRWALTAGFLIFAVGLLFPALAGLARPLQLQAPQHLLSAWNVLRESMAVTVFYGLCAGVVGSALGVAAGWAAGPVSLLRRLVLAASFILMAMPASLTALGILVISARLPPSFDAVTRSGWVVGVAYGIRFAPLAVVLCLHAGCQLPRSQSDAATLHGVPFWKWLLRVVLPHLRPSLMVCVLVIALLSLAEVSTTLLLQPPGQASFPARIFSVLDNISERALAALCVVYISAGATLLSLFFVIGRRATGERRR